MSFSVSIHVKPYVKKYLENRFGDPVDLSGDKHINKYFLNLLDKNSYRFDKRIFVFGKNAYKEEVTILISEDAFERFGFDLSKTSIIDFNNFIEEYIKTQSRLFVGVCSGLGVKVAVAIRNFQNIFQFEEDDFAFETIKKDIQRNGFTSDYFKKLGTTVPKK